MRIRYGYRGVLSDGQAERLLGRLFYSVEGLSGCTLDPRAGDIVVDAPSGSTLEKVRATLAVLAAREREVPAVPERRLMERAADAGGGSRVEGGAGAGGEGTVLRGLAALLPQRLDRFFLDLALGMGAEPRQYPAMIPFAAMEACHYIEHFPQDIYGVYEFPHDAEVLAQMVATHDYRTPLRPTSSMLAPAICYHCYHELAGQRIRAPLLLTAEGHCFRHEAPWRLNAHRLLEFRMREIVFYGDPAFVRETRGRMMAATWQAFAAFGLGGHVQTASDPFYFTRYAELGRHQLLHDMKYELVGTPSGEEAFSLASFNDLGDSLCAPFDVCDAGGRPLHSGCVGFGLERWARALVATHGDDPAAWPGAALRLLGLARDGADPQTGMRAG